MSARRFLLAATLLFTASAASAQTIDAARSSVSATFKQMGVPVEGKFKKVGGQVVYDPANPAAAQAKVDVDIASFDLGDAQYNREVLQKEWFDAARFPAASLVSTSARAVAVGKLAVGARLTIKGVGNLFQGEYTVTDVAIRYDAAAGLRTEFLCDRPAIGRG